MDTGLVPKKQQWHWVFLIFPSHKMEAYFAKSSKSMRDFPAGPPSSMDGQLLKSKRLSSDQGEGSTVWKEPQRVDVTIVSAFGIFGLSFRMAYLLDLVF